MTWKWNIAICDDDPTAQTILATQNAFENEGFGVVIIDTPNTFCNKLEELRRSHLILMDMQWNNFGDSSLQECWVPQDMDWNEFNSKINTIEWIDAIHYWVPDNNNRAATDNRWPRAQINDSEIGVWLAALASHLAENAQIVLYSSKTDVLASGFGAGLGRFRKPFYKVITKPQGGLRPLHPDIIPCLIYLQIGYLKKQQIYDWFLEDVLFRLLLDKEPKKRTIKMVDIDNNISALEMDAKLFFPQLINANDRCEQIKTLLMFVYSSTMTEDIRIVFDKVKNHDLGDFKLEQLKNRVSDVLRGEILEGIACSVAGAYPYGELASGLLFKAAQEQNANIAIEYATKAINLINIQQEETPIYWLWNTWIKSCESKSLRIQGKCAGVLLKSKISNFNISAFDNMLSALEHNSEKFNQQYTVSCFKSDNDIVIQFLTVWDDFTKDAFNSEISISMEKSEGGRTRGLPLAILCGLRYGVKNIALCVNEKWNCIYPDPSEIVESDNLNEHDKLNFGFRWRFPTI